MQTLLNSVSTYNHWAPPERNIEDPYNDSLKFQNAKSLAKQGLISKAASVLDHLPMALATNNTYQLLQQLYSRRAKSTVSAISPSTSVLPVIDMYIYVYIINYLEFLIAAIKDAPKMSALGR